MYTEKLNIKFFNLKYKTLKCMISNKIKNICFIIYTFSY